MFELVVLLLPGHMWRSIGVHQLWARPCFPSCVLHVWFIIYIYIYRSTLGEFKTRYYNHKTSFSHEKYRHSTTLSSYVWELKDNKGIDPIMKWEVVKKCRKYRAGDRGCLLCMEEKLAIASCKSRDMLNQRSEVLDSCRHKRAWLLYN